MSHIPKAGRSTNPAAAGLTTSSTASSPSSAALTVAEVRQALHAVRSAWYDSLSPSTPFLFSSVALENRYVLAEFACVFDYGQHVKRHQRLIPTTPSTLQATVKY